jgi:hypothetical protein
MPADTAACLRCCSALEAGPGISVARCRRLLNRHLLPPMKGSGSLRALVCTTAIQLDFVDQHDLDPGPKLAHSPFPTGSITALRPTPSGLVRVLKAPARLRPR